MLQDHTWNNLAIERHLNEMRHRLVGHEGCQEPLIAQRAYETRDVPAVHEDLQVARTGLRTID